MIVVTGAPRTGTSLVMQILGCLGLKLTGVDYHPSFGPKEFFPNGAWCLPTDEDEHGIIDHRYKGKAVKLFAGSLYQTESKLISKLIVCRRNLKDAVESSFKLMQVTPDLRGVEPTRENATKLYEISYRMIEHYLRDNNVISTNIDFENVLRHPVLSVDKIKMFIGSEMNITDAVKNINSGKGV